jgi:resuscitation-promoting factor RpfB
VKPHYPLGTAILVLLVACQPQARAAWLIVDGSHLQVLASPARVPEALLAQSGVVQGPADRLLVNGSPFQLDQPVPSAPNNTLQIMRAVTLTVNGKSILTTAGEIGQALSESGINLYAADQLDPPGSTPIMGPASVHYVPSKELTVNLDGRQVLIRSSAPTVFSALAQAGVPVLGLDYTQPAENEPLPSDGRIRLIRVTESILLAQKSIPFTTQFQASADVELDHQDILQPGQPGLAVTRTRIRYEDRNRCTAPERSVGWVRDEGSLSHRDRRWCLDPVLADGADVCDRVFAV